MAILTEKKKLKLKRNKIILNKFNKLMAIEGSQKQAVYEKIKEELQTTEYKCSLSTVQKVVNFNI